MKSLKNKIILIILIIILIPTVITAVYFSVNVRGKMIDDATYNIEFYLETTSNQLENALSNVESVALTLLVSDDVRQLVTDYDNQSVAEKSQVIDILNDAVKYSAAWDASIINSVFIFKDEDHFISQYREIGYDSVAARNIRVYNEFTDFRSFSTFVKPSYSDKYLYYIVDVFDTVNFTAIGKVIIEINPDNIIDFDSIRKIYPNTQIMLYDSKRDNEIYSSIDTDYDGKYYNYEYGTYSNDIMIKLAVAKSDISADINPTLYIFYLLSFISLIIVVMLAYFSYKNIAVSLQSLEKSLKGMKDGDFSVRAETSEYVELNTVVNTFNDMADNIEALFGEVYEKKAELTKIERIMLQSQINPHFIFNVLEVINMKALDIGANNISKMIVSLAKLIRSNILLEGQESVTVKQELEYVKYYLHLQSERFTNRFKFNISFEDEVLDIHIPKLIIQPLVENAVVHGIEPMEKEGLVSVNVWEEESCIYIRVSDNGVGFDMENTSQDNEKHNNLAMANIKRRLELIYGNSHSFIIKSKVGQGTNIVIVLDGGVLN